MADVEKSPLLSSSNENLLPPLRPPSAYGVIEVHPYYNIQSKPKRRSLPVFAFILVGVAVGLVFGIAAILTYNADQSGVPTLLGQSGPSSVSTYLDLTIPQGRLRGYLKKSRQGRDYTAFFKVPYAASPLKKLRFRDPQPATPWGGLRDYKEVARQCIQKEKYSAIDEAVGDEDCLYSNIYVPGSSPSEHSSNLLPTMVYIHGGGFTDGNGSRYGPDYFMDEDVVLVTFQYRLGPLGFLNTEDGVIRGNMGLKDQVQMLRWVKQNIKYFGGNPERVTIFGNSGGGMSVSLLMLSPLANGLFHRAITQSGGALCDSSNDLNGDNPRATVEEVGRVLDCPTEDSNAFLECLEGKDASDIVLVRTPKTVYGLTVERTNDSGVFLSRNPYEMLENGWTNKVPFIIGNVNGEIFGPALDILEEPDTLQKINKDFTDFLKTRYNITITPKDDRDLKQVYFGGREITSSSTHGLAYLMADIGMIHCSFVEAKMHSKYSPTYMYHLTKPPYKSYVDKTHPGFPAKELGLVHHADELQYFFLYYGYPEITEGDPEYYDFSRYLVRLWAHFATTGEPTMDGITWDTLDSDLSSPFWFELGDAIGKTTDLQDRMNFWDRFSHKELHYT